MQRYGTGLACFIAINMEIIFKKKKKKHRVYTMYQIKSQVYNLSIKITNL